MSTAPLAAAIDADPAPETDFDTVGRLIPYYGCKAALTPRLLPMIDWRSVRMLLDGFAGSLAFSLAAPVIAHHIANDLNANMTNLAFVLQSSRWSELAERLQRTLHCEDLQRTACVAMEAIDESGLEPVRSPDEIDDAHVAWAYWLMVRDWLGINGVSGTTRTNHHPALRLTPNGGGGASRWAAVVGSIPAWVERVRAIQIVRRDVFELLPDVDDDKGVFVYLDPPYVLGSRGSVRTRYAHDVPRGADAERAWHTRLRDQAARFKSARVMLSYYEHPMLRELYTPADGWTIRPVPVSKSMASITARKANKGTALEIVILNAAAAADTGPNLFTAHEPESENP